MKVFTWLGKAFSEFGGSLFVFFGICGFSGKEKHRFFFQKLGFLMFLVAIFEFMGITSGIFGTVLLIEIFTIMPRPCLKHCESSTGRPLGPFPACYIREAKLGQKIRALEFLALRDLEKTAQEVCFSRLKCAPSGIFLHC